MAGLIWLWNQGGAAPKQVDGVALSVTPTLPTGLAYLHPVGVVLQVTPTFPAGRLDHYLGGVALSETPTQPVAVLQPQAA